MLNIVVLLVALPKVMVSCKSPASNPSGSLTTMYEPFSPGTPNSGPTFSTVNGVPDACTDSIDGLGCVNPRSDVNKTMRVRWSALKLNGLKSRKGPRTNVTESRAAALFVPVSVNITGGEAKTAVIV